MPVVHCQRDEFDVYIGRGRGSRWGNPYSHKQVPGTKWVATRDEAVEKYREWLWQAIRDGAVSLEDLAQLHGKRLGCWCAPLRCHGEVLVAAAAWAVAQSDRKRRRVQTPACDRCSVGVMDATNPHLLGTCGCDCHREQPRRA